jgi:hypothetical protein
VKVSKLNLQRKRNRSNARRRAERNLPAQYTGLVALVRFANLLHGRRDAAREALKAYETYLILFRIKPPVDVREVYESEAERARAKWEQLGAPIWQSARREFPLVGDRAALPPLADGLVKFEDAGELVRAALAVDEILRLIAGKAAEGTVMPIDLPQPQIVAPRITIDPATGRALIAQDLVGEAILPAIKPQGVDLRRLRVCPVCERLFVAARHDAMACSPGCLSIERQRRYRNDEKRKEYREHLKRNRKARQAKKKRDARRARPKGD